MQEGQAKDVPGSQPAPVPNQSVPVWNLVMADMLKRDHVGRQRYGTPLQAFNGHDALQDAYEEALDLCVYLRQAIEERRLRLRDASISETFGRDPKTIIEIGCQDSAVRASHRNDTNISTKRKNRTWAEVMYDRKHGGCCNANRNNQACNCLEEATCSICHNPNCREQNQKH